MGAIAQSLIQGTDGNFYGMTNLAGATNNGVVFRVTPAGVETVLHSFGGANDGNPESEPEGDDGHPEIQQPAAHLPTVSRTAARGHQPRCVFRPPVYAAGG